MLDTKIAPCHLIITDTLPTAPGLSLHSTFKFTASRQNTKQAPARKIRCAHIRNATSREHVPSSILGPACFVCHRETLRIMSANYVSVYMSSFEKTFNATDAQLSDAIWVFFFIFLLLLYSFNIFSFFFSAILSIPLSFCHYFSPTHTMVHFSYTPV